MKNIIVIKIIKIFQQKPNFIIKVGCQLLTYIANLSLVLANAEFPLVYGNSRVSMNGNSPIDFSPLRSMKNDGTASSMKTDEGIKYPENSDMPGSIKLRNSGVGT